MLAATLIMAVAVGQVWNELQHPLTVALSGVNPGSLLFTLLHLKYFCIAVFTGIIIYVLCTFLFKSDNAAYLWAAAKQAATRLPTSISKRRG